MSDFWSQLDHARDALQGPDADLAKAARLTAALWAKLDADPPQRRDARRGILSGFIKTYNLDINTPAAPPLAAPSSEAPSPAPLAAIAVPTAVSALAPAIAISDNTKATGPALTDYVAQTKPGVSLVTASRNRSENLLRALPSWLACAEISQIVIIDWGSDIPVSESLDAAGMTDPRIVVARVDSAARWVLSYAFNAGFRLAAHHNILKVDADIVLSKRFFRDNKLKPNHFIAGNWRTAPKGQEFVNGFFYLSRELLMQVKGFNEYITTYGWDDDDIYARLIEAGGTRVDVAPNTVQHLDHDDTARLETHDADQPRSGWDDLHALTMYKIRTNRFVATIMPNWDGNRIMMPFAVQQTTPARLQLVPTGWIPHETPDHIFATAQQLAAYELVSWRAGLETYQLSSAGLDNLLRQTRLDAIDKSVVASHLATAPAAPEVIRPGRKRLYLDAQHGLGNRLRAIGSAHAVAQATDRELVVIWEADHHCDAPIDALIQAPCAVINESFLDRAKREGMTVLNYMELEADSAKDAPLTLVSDRDAYVRSAYVINHPASHWDSENALLQQLQPVAAIQEMLDPFPAQSDIGLHIRMEGASGTDLQSYDAPENWSPDSHAAITAWRDKSHYSAFMARLDTLLAEQPDARVFLAADQQQTYDAFAQTYGPRVAGLSRDLFDRSAEQLQYALADILLLARNRILLGSNWSSFTEAALRVSTTITQQERSGIDF